MFYFPFVFQCASLDCFKHSLWEHESIAYDAAESPSEGFLIVP